MIVLAAIPSVSVLAVTARAAAFGFSHGMFAALGIVAGDIIFILIAVYGLAFIAEMMGEQFAIIKLLGGAYLIWLGISLWRADARMRSSDSPAESSWSSSFMTGLLITLGDQKAILFYLGFFPAFIDLSNMTPADTLIIIVIAALGGPCVGGGLAIALACAVFRAPGSRPAPIVPPHTSTSNGYSPCHASGRVLVVRPSTIRVSSCEDSG